MRQTVAHPVLGMILKGFPRISETFISNEIRLLEKEGFRIHIFSMRHPRESFSHQSVRRIRAAVDYLPQTILGGLPRLLFHNLRACRNRPRAYLSALRLAVRRFRRTRKSATIKHLLQAGYLVDRLLPGRGVVHLHAHFAHSPTSVALFAARISGLPFSFTAHAKDIYTSDPRQLTEKLHLARFAVTCTDYNRRHLRHLAPDAPHLHRVYHGIDMTLFAHDGHRYRPRPPYVILTIARLVPKKGLFTVYDALTRLRQRGVDFQHLLIGDGELRGRIRRRIQNPALAGRCRWLGTLPHETVLDHLRRADLFMLGCRIAENGDRDGIPNVLVEAMAMGVPAVATRRSAIPELIDHEATGLLVPPENPEALADAAFRLLTDSALRRRIIPAAEARVRADFDNRLLIRQLADIYRNGQPLLNTRRP